MLTRGNHPPGIIATLRSHQAGAGCATQIGDRKEGSKMNRSRVFTAVSVLPMVLLLSWTAPATAGEKGDWQLRFGFVSSDADAGRAEVSATGESFNIITSSGAGFGASLEYRFSGRLGVDLGVFSAAPDIGTSISIGPGKESLVNISTGVTITPVTVGLNVHLIPDGLVDVYVGPLVGYVMYNDFTLSAGPGIRETFRSENDFAWGAGLGADLRFGKSRWSLTAALKYLDSTFEARPESGGSAGAADFKSTSFSFGAGYRF
jgi:outer membrane protein W